MLQHPSAGGTETERECEPAFASASADKSGASTLMKFLTHCVPRAHHAKAWFGSHTHTHTASSVALAKEGSHFLVPCLLKPSHSLLLAPCFMLNPPEGENNNSPGRSPGGKSIYPPPPRMRAEGEVGSSRFSKKDRKNFMVITRGSAFDSAAIIDYLYATVAMNEEE